jgi:hypothetical protein
MLLRRVDVRSGPSRRPGGRRGAGIPWFIVTAPFLALIAVWVVHTASLYHRQAELEVTAEATAKDAARELVEDLLLTELPSRQDAVEQQARLAGRDTAGRNKVFNQAVKLQDNRRNDPAGELTIGTLANPFSHDFDSSCRGIPLLYGPNRNAVRVALKRCGVAASATAFVDRDVLGFQIQGLMSLPGQSIPAIPVMPLALFTDPVYGREGHDGKEHKHDGKEHAGYEALCSGRDRRSWEYQIIARRGGDRFRLGHDRDGRLEVRAVEGEERGDGIPEMRVTLCAGSGQQDNGQLALVGVETVRAAADQLLTGMTYQQLMARNGQLFLGQDEGASTPRNELLLPRGLTADAELDYLGERLRQIIGQPRVWMLYSHILEDKKSHGRLRVVGFVAARVMAVNGETHGGDGRHEKHESTSLEVVLQPCMMVTATAVTDYRRRDLGPRTLFNPYVCKVRLVE